MSSIWQDIYAFLKEKGIEVYSPGQHQGECISKYVVVKPTGSSRIGGFSSTNNTYDLLCYVPKEEFSKLEEYVKQVKDYMKELFPKVKTTYYQTPAFYDDQIKGHMISVEYLNIKKI